MEKVTWPEDHLGGVVVLGVGDGLDDGPVHQGHFTVKLSTHFLHFFQAVYSLENVPQWLLSCDVWSNSPHTTRSPSHFSSVKERSQSYQWCPGSQCPQTSSLLSYHLHISLRGQTAENIPTPTYRSTTKDASQPQTKVIIQVIKMLTHTPLVLATSSLEEST